MISQSQRKFFGLLLKIAVSLSILAYLAYAVDWPTLLTRMLQVHPGYFIGAIVAMAFPIALTSIRWQVILRAQKIVIPIRKVISFDLVALFFNAFLPGSTGGDAARVVYAINLHPREKTRIVLSILADRGIGLLTLLTFGFLILQFQPGLLGKLETAQALAKILPLLLLALLAGLAGLLFLPYMKGVPVLQKLLAALPEHPLAQNSVLFLKEFAKKPGAVLITLVISAASYLFNFSSGYLVGLALGLTVNFSQIIVMLAFVYTITSLPISVGGHGVRELTLIAMFGLMGLSAPGQPEVAIAFSILLFSVQLIWSLIGGLYYLAHRQVES